MRDQTKAEILDRETISWISKQRSFLLLVGIASLILNVLGYFFYSQTVFQGHLIDTDSYMLLERVAQEIQHRDLTDLVLRDDSGLGVSVGWSHITDATIILLALPFLPFLPLKGALFWGGVCLGPLMSALLGAGLAFSLYPLVKRRYLWVIPFLLIAFPAFRIYGAPGVVTHHIAMLVAVAWTLGFAVRTYLGSDKAGLWAGFFGALAIGVTPETLPFVFACYGVVLARGIEHGEFAPLASLAKANLAATVGLTVLDMPAHDLSQNWIDGPSLVYVTLAILIVAGAFALRHLARSLTGWRSRLFLSGLCGVVLVGTWVACFPELRGGVGAGVPASVSDAFYGDIIEMQPLRGYLSQLMLVGPGVIAGVLCMAVFFFTKNWRYAVLGNVALFASVFGTQHMRFAEWSALAAAVATPLLLNKIGGLWGDDRRLNLACQSLFVTAMILVPWTPAFASVTRYDRDLFAAYNANNTCPTSDLASLMQPYAGKIVLASVNYTPELLWRTDVITTGSLYSRGVWGYLRNQAAFASSVAGPTEPLAVMKTGAQYVLWCPINTTGMHGLTIHIGNYKDTSLQAALQSGTVPSWLKLITTDSASKFRIYQVLNAPAIRAVRTYH